jgi:hypothetical protein
MNQMGWDGMYSSYSKVVDWFQRGRSRASFQEQITAQIPSAALDQFKAVGSQFNDLLLKTIASAA